MSKIEELESKEYYDALLKSGLFSEIFPELSGYWELNKHEIKDKMSKNQNRYICWLKRGRIDTVKCTAETEKHVFTEEYGRLAKSASTHRVRNSMPDACNTMRYFYEERIRELEKESEQVRNLYDYWKNTYMI